MAEYTSEAAATKLGVSVFTVRRQVTRGKLQSRRNEEGRLVIILPDDPPSAEHTSEQQARNPLARGEHPGEQLLAEKDARIIGLEEQLTVAVQRETALLNRLTTADTERAELRQLLTARDQAESELRQLLLQAQLQLQALLPKLMPPEEPLQPRQPWWRWW